MATTSTSTSSTATPLRDLGQPNTLSSIMELGDHRRHRVDEDEEEEEEEEEGSEEMMMMMNNNTSSGLNRVKMAEALSQVQIQPVPPPMTAAGSKPRYRECLRNHAINVMGHALDGCGEFMPGGPEGSVEALKCAACGCHRNFHRKEDVAGDSTATLLYPQHPLHHHHQPLPPTPSNPFGSYYRPNPSGYLHLGPPPQPRPLALPSISGAGGSLSRGEDDDVSNPNGAAMIGMGNGNSSGKKRFRTKFTAEQKERMLAMAERIGWRIQKCDEDLVQQFCHEAGVKRHVFKVWMHNNKHTLGKTINMSTNNNNNSSSSNSSKQQQQLMS